LTGSWRAEEAALFIVSAVLNDSTPQPLVEQIRNIIDEALRSASFILFGVC
jgi:hypothetical protein